ncbi:AAA family ATPase [Streptococcus sp. S784/96/1]|uniref:AAA family ATPase n=1 Tax=Streptococcus sp. S784/96/1 TaxID=2653499 RepID=UPI00138762FE|nr:AAA family ATPase [Streptococcus sp. S784/96/1]
MIKNFNSITSKSFINYSNDEPLEKVNIMFGMNGSGKSSLSAWIRNVNPEHTRVFDTSYVDQNIRITDSHEIDGVKITVGEKEIDFSDQIDRLENANQNMQAVNNKLKEQKNSLEKELFGLMDNTLKEVKQAFIGVKINQKSNAKTKPLQALEAWRKESSNSVEKTSAVSSQDLENQKAKLENELEIVQPLLGYFTDDMFISLNKYLSKPIPTPEKSYSNNLLGWIEEGLNVHNLLNEVSSENKQCEFCGNAFNSRQVMDEITKKLDSEYSALIKTLDIFEKSLEGVSLSDKLVKKVDNTELIENFNRSKQELKSIVEKKRGNTLDSLQVSDELITRFRCIDIKLKELKKQFEEELEIINDSLNTLEHVAKYQIGNKLSDNKRVDFVEKQLKLTDKIISNNNLALDKNNEKITEWKNTKSDYNAFKNLVNSEFQKLGFEFKLEIIETGFGYKLSHSNPLVNLKVKDLSEGERRFLAFLHFYYDLFESINEDGGFIDSTIKTIVIDDPITSFDADNRIYLIERINHFISKIQSDNVQLFVLTHSSYDFHNFGYNAGSYKKMWRILKGTDGHSYIQNLKADELKNFSDYYKSIFLEVADFALLNKTKIQECVNPYTFGNKMRLILESNARSNYNIENVTSKSISNLITYYQVEKVDEKPFEDAVNLINSLSHGRSYYDESLNQITPKQIQKAIRFILKVFGNKDINHLKIMTNNKIRQLEIDNWFQN